MHGDQDGPEGPPATAGVGGTDNVTVPIRLPVDDTAEPGNATLPPATTGRFGAGGQTPTPPGSARSEEVRAFGNDVERLAELVGQLTAAASQLGKRLDDEVRGVLDTADRALDETRGARQEATEAADRTREAEAREETALKEAADARTELLKGLAAAKASVTAAQESEANAWKEAGAAQQARATAANEAAYAEGLRKHAEAGWGTEHKARTDTERERDDLAARLAGEQSALASARTEVESMRADLEGARSELAGARTKLEAAAESERLLRVELSAAKGEIAGLTVERDSVASRAAELAIRADRAEERADSAEARADRAQERADRADVRTDAAEIRIDRDAATVRTLQDTLRAALDLPAVEDLADGQGVQVDEAAVTARPGGLVGVDQVPDVMDGELAGRFARAILAVRVHQATHRPFEDEEPEQEEDASEG